MSGSNLPPEEMTAHMSTGQNGMGPHAVPPVGQPVPPGLLPPARDPEKFAQAMMQAQQLKATAEMLQQIMPPPSQRWQCAVCLGISKTWEQANQAGLAPVIAQVQALAAAGQQVPDVKALIPPELAVSMPQVFEAATIATVPGAGLAAVCPGHAPAWDDGPARPTLLVAPGGLDMSAIVRMATGG